MTRNANSIENPLRPLKHDTTHFAFKPNSNNALDSYTDNHLRDWIQRTISENITVTNRERVYKSIREFLAERTGDAGYWLLRSWPEIMQQARIGYYDI